MRQLAWRLGVLALVFLFCGCGNADLALYEAVERGEVGNVERLLEEGASATQVPEGKTLLPLEVAARQGNPNIVTSLLRRGAHPDSARGPEKPLWLALANGNEAAVVALVNAGAGFSGPLRDGLTPFQFSVAHGDRSAALAMLQKGADPNSPMPGRTPLHEAAEAGDTVLVLALIQAGADLDATDSAGETPLFAAVLQEDLNTAELLAHQGADPNAQNSKGETILHQLAALNKTEAIEAVIAWGADPSLPNQLQETPLHTAVLLGRMDAAEVLLKAGARVNAVTSYGTTAARIAFERGDEPLLDLLVIYGGHLR